MSINTTTNIYGSTVTYFLGLFRSSLTDVASPSAIGSFDDARLNTTSWVVSAFPQPKKYGNFPGYPIVIVKSPDINEENITLNQTKQNLGRLTIQILDKASSPINVDNVAGQIKYVLINNQTSINSVGICGVNLVGTVQSDMVGGDDTIVKTMDYDIVYRNLEGYV